MKAFDTRLLGRTIAHTRSKQLLALVPSFHARSTVPRYRYYNAEVNEYVYNIKGGNIPGVDPGVIDVCPVCSVIHKKLAEGITVMPCGLEIVEPSVSLPVATQLWESTCKSCPREVQILLISKAIRYDQHK